jgi:hypothetical protein
VVSALARHGRGGRREALKTAMKAFSVQPVWQPKLDICLGNFGKPLIQLFLIGAQLRDTLIPQHAP